VALPTPSAGSAALVTGASSGIGTELARGLAQRGHNLILVARRAERLQDLARELSGAHGISAQALPTDLADADARAELVRRVRELDLEVSVLVNCAGAGGFDWFLDSDPEREIQTVRLDVEAVIDLTARFAPAMVAAGRGTILTLGSASGLQPVPGHATYSAAKAAVNTFCEALHSELAGTGVTVTVVMPGPVPSGFQEANQATFAQRLPGFVWVQPERVARDALRAAERGRRAIIPGGPLVRLAFGPNRFAPRFLGLPIAKRMSAPIQPAARD
jgi:short-subunit dehydrogenase